MSTSILSLRNEAPMSLYEPIEKESVLKHEVGQAFLKLQERLQIRSPRATLTEARRVHEVLESIELLQKRIEENLASHALSVIEKKELESLLSKVKCEIQSVHSLLSFEKPLSFVKKWIAEGYDAAILETDPLSVQFIVESGLIYSIKMYKEAQGTLTKEDVDLHFSNGKTLIKVKGEWKLYSEITESIFYNQNDQKIDGWVFTHPKGFIPTDGRVQSCAQLSVESHKALGVLAEKFWRTHPEVDPEIPKKCVLQIVESQDGRILPAGRLLDNFEKWVPRHVRLRLIDEEGCVYSLGTHLSKEDSDYVFGYMKMGGLSISLRSTDTKIESPDYEESRKFSNCEVVSIPLSQERLEKIKDTVECINKKGGIRFCFTKQNCCRFCEEMVKLAGVSINTKLSGPAFFYRVLPDLSSLPLIGKPVAFVARTIASVFARVHDFCEKYTPQPIQPAFICVSKVVSYIPKKMSVLFCNLIFLALGGGQGNKSLIQKDTGKGQFESFKRLISSGLDLFKQSTSSIYHGKLMANWMRQQSSYQSFNKSSSGFVILRT